MTLNIDLEDVPDAILEAVKARIMANRRRLLDREELLRQPPLQPKPQFRKFGADSKTWKRPQPAAVPSGGSGWLLVPSGPWQSSLQGFQCVVTGLPSLPFQAAQNSFAYVNQSLVPIDAVNENNERVINSNGSYDTTGNRPSGAVIGSQLGRFTFEGFIDPGDPDLLFSNRKGREIREMWYWSYVVDSYLDDLREPGGDTYLGRFTITYTGLPGANGYYTKQPGPPSADLAPWPTIGYTDAQGNPCGGPGQNACVIKRTAVLISETRIDLQAPGYEPSPVYEGYYYVSLTVSAVDNPTNVYLEAGVAVNLQVQEGTAASASLVLFVNSDPGSGQQPIQDWQSIQITPSTGKRHFAFVVQEDTIVGYINGLALMELPLPDGILDSAQRYHVQVSIDANATDLDTERVEPPGNVLEQGIGADPYGELRMVDASKHALSGIRFTPGRALYQGPSFTPPTSINRLA